MLKPSGSSIQAVSDKASLDKIFDDYVTKSFDTASLTASFNSINASFSRAYPVVESCAIGSNQFITSLPRKYVLAGRIPLPLLYLLKHGENTTAKVELAAIASINSTVALMNSALVDANSSFKDFKEGVASNELDLSLSSASKLAKSVSLLSSLYVNESTSYAALVNSKGDGATYSGVTLAYMYYISGVKHDCAYNSSTAADLAKVQSELSAGSFKTSSELSAQVSLATNDRSKSALVKQFSVIKAADLTEAGANAKGVVENYSKASSITLTAIAERQALLQKTLDSIKTAKDSNDAQAKASVFDSTLKQFQEDLLTYQVILPDYKLALENYANATVAVAQAEKRYSSSDERVLKLTTDLSALKASLNSGEQSLSNGNLASVKFKPLAANASSITASAMVLAPKESLLDPVILVGVVVVLLLLAGTVWYLKKMKAQQPQKEISLQESNENMPKSIGKKL